MAMESAPQLIADYQCQTGEGPLWVPGEHSLYWVDIPPGRLFRYHPATGRHEQVFQTERGEALGGVTAQAGGGLLLFLARGTIKQWSNGRLSTVVEEIPEDRDSRFNDVIADPAGRVFGGTMPTDAHPGRLYRIDLDGSVHKVLDDTGIPNGMGFTLDRKQMYFTDTTRREISLFDYDEDTGEIANRRVFVSAQGDGVPDGMTVDAEGYVWSARWDGGCLVRYAPDGSEARRVTFPAKKVSSAIFGGDDLADLYVTTAGGPHKAEEGPGAGALFRFRPGVRGGPEYLSRIRPAG